MTSPGIVGNRAVLGALLAGLLVACGAQPSDQTSLGSSESAAARALASVPAESSAPAAASERPLAESPVPSLPAAAVSSPAPPKAPARQAAAPPPAPPAPPPRTPSPWALGASPLPLRPDGFGEILPTPESLRDRRLPTADLLPPPADARFASSIGAVTAPIRERMGESWSPACPVALDGLRYLTVSFRGFDGQAHTGELVVAASVADDIVTVFRALYEAEFPIEEMRLPTTADLKAAPTGDGNNTAAYVCRAARGQTKWSQHAYGTAVDINPFHNPLVKGDLVIPELASAYATRSAVRPGMHVADGPAVRAFEAIGWSWGGRWRSSKDWMHFSLSGG